MEEHKVDPLGSFSLNYFNRVLTPNLVKSLMGVFGGQSKQLIKEFIFGLDLLVELVNDEQVPLKRLLNNSDVNEALVFNMKNKAIMEGKTEYYGCQISPKATALIEEFFEYKYIRLFNYVLQDLKAPKIIYFNGSYYVISINRRLSVSTKHCALNFKQVEHTERRIIIPFNYDRLVK